ncbi:Uncharacterised protein [Mycobacteroides abscessus subsp. abscessus]|nr:Uncharacterised protein [Mycobacteroides abscessus subsp. abscessus]
MVGRQHRLQERTSFCFKEGEPHRCSDAALNVAGVFGEDGVDTLQEALTLGHHERVTESLLIAELLI